MMFTRRERRRLTIREIEEQIVLRLAQHVERDPQELRLELLHADSDLPIERRHAQSILGALERDFGVDLVYERAVEPRLDYARELALFIQGRLLSSRT
jgi:hypothetical protein